MLTVIHAVFSATFNKIKRSHAVPLLEIRWLDVFLANTISGG